MLNNNWIALLITFGLALTWLRINDFAAQRGWVSSDLSRKIIHMGTGPLFVVCWLLFHETPSARYLAALVPLAITAQFILVGAGLIRDQSAVQAMSRSGDRREILRGPLYYGIIFVLVTVIYWRNSLIGVNALMILCGGDGFADIIGRRFGGVRLPWNPRKSWAGSLGMFLGSWVFVVLIDAIFSAAGYTSIPLASLYLPITGAALAAALVESLPLADIDNISVTLVSIALGHLWFG